MRPILATFNTGHCIQVIVYRLILPKFFYAVLGQNTQVNAGGDGSGGEFYKVTLEPDDWWKLFPEAKDDNGWTSVSTQSVFLYICLALMILLSILQLTQAYSSLN